MLEAGVIEHCISPWLIKTKYLMKLTGALRMVHQYLALNAAMIKANCPVWCLDLVVN